MTVEAALPRTWEVVLSLEAREVEAPEVQWAMFEQDPMPRFEKELEARAPSCREWLGRIQESGVRERTRISFLIAAWDHVFRTLTEENVHLAPAPRSGHAVGFTAAPGRKWAATRATRGAYCWCAPVDAVPGQTTPIALSDANAVNLAQRSWP